MKNTSKEYIALIEEGGIFSRSLSKGTFILPPNGMRIWNAIRTFLSKKFSDLGVEEVSLPSLVPFSLMKKEKDHVEGFSPEVFFVSSKKITKDTDLVLRPTSEALFYEWFSRILKSQRQLPILYNQWCQVFRVEKNTKPFLRNSEFLWQEGHTLHLSKNEAEEFVFKVFSLYKQYTENFLCISTVVGTKTENEKFAGALKTYTVECLLPDYQCLQLATAHFFSDKFSKAFSVKFNSSSNEQKYPYSTSWGTSTRAMGALAISHSDEKGLVFPFDLSPVQVSIIKYGSSEELTNYVSLIKNMISSKYRTKIYQSSSHANVNINISEKEGCPFKIIIGDKELSDQNLTVSIRTKGEKFFIKKNKILDFIEEKKSDISKFLLEKSTLNKNNKSFRVNNYEEFFSLKNLKKGLLIVPFCNIVECELEFKKRFSPLSFRCILSEEVDNVKGCIFCNRKFSYESVVGRSY